MANFAVKSGGAPEPHGGRFASAVSKEPTGSMPNSWKRLQAANLSSRLWPSWRCRCPLRQIKVVSGITSLIQSGRSRARSLCGKPECRTGAPDHQFQGALADFALQSLAVLSRHTLSTAAFRREDHCVTVVFSSPLIQVGSVLHLDGPLAHKLDDTLPELVGHSSHYSRPQSTVRRQSHV